MPLAYLSLGSNLGDREAYLRGAVSGMKSTPGINVVAESSLVETPPWGITAQPAFLNSCVAVQTELSPLELLAVLQQLEIASGRVRTKKWGPRTLDIDILCYDEVTMNTPELTLPHPYMTEREFVLAPLVQIAQNLLIKGKTVRTWLAELAGK